MVDNFPTKNSKAMLGWRKTKTVECRSSTKYGKKLASERRRQGKEKSKKPMTSAD